MFKLSPDAQIAPPQRFAEEKAYILTRIEKEGFDPKVINQIIMCESGYNPLAKHWNPPTATRPGTWDIGIWQINDVHGLSVADREDVVKSTDYAISLIRSAGLKSWMCYR